MSKKKKPAEAKLPAKLAGVTLPKGMRIGKPHPRFTAGVLKHVRKQFADLPRSRGEAVWFGSHDTPDAVHSYNLWLIDRDGVVLWVARHLGSNHRACAGGWLYYKGGALIEQRAAVEEGHRRRGIYRAVLRDLRAYAKRPLLSDEELSAANAVLWASVGVVAGRRFRINPRRPLPKAVREVLWCWKVVDG